MEPPDEQSKATNRHDHKWLILGPGALLMIGCSVYSFLYSGVNTLLTFETRAPASAVAETQYAGFDADGDHFPNVLEPEYGTDPNNPDTDSDHLMDFDELMVWGTNPTLNDTDDDG